MNGQLIAGRAAEAGMTFWDLADELCIDPQILWANLDRDRQLPFGLFQDLSFALGVPIEDLVSPDRTPPLVEANDDVKVEAALVELRSGVTPEGLADALGWSLDRVHRALERLGTRLSTTGQRLRAGEGGDYTLRPAPGSLKECERAALRLTGVDDSLGPEEAALLLEVGFGFERRERMRRAERDAFRGPVQRGLVLLRPGRVVLTPDVEFSLRLAPDDGTGRALRLPAPRGDRSSGARGGMGASATRPTARS